MLSLLRPRLLHVTSAIAFAFSANLALAQAENNPPLPPPSVDAQGNPVQAPPPRQGQPVVGTGSSPANNAPQAPAIAPRPSFPSSTTGILPPSAPDAMIGPIKFGDLTIDAALEMLERWSGRVALRPNALPATTISFNLDQKVTKTEARQALETLLTLNGIAITPLGAKFMKVTALANARTESPDFIEGSTLDLPPGGRVAQKLFQLKFLRISEFIPQLQGIMQPGLGAAPVLFEKTNAALITDTVSNLQRIEMLAEKLDQPNQNGMTPKFYKLKHSSASDIAQKLQTLFAGPAAAQISTGTVFQADDRTSQLLILTDGRQQSFFDEIIARLDSEGETNTRQEVIPLKHADAATVAQLLSQLVSGQNSGTNSRPGQNNQPRQVSFGGQNLNNANNNNANRNPNQTNNNNNNNNTTALPAAVNLALSALQGATQQQFSTVLTVVPDTRSNALVASGTSDDIRLLKDLVTQLDVILAQVRIEVVIAEITLDDNIQTGIDALGLVVQGNKLVGFAGSGPGFSIAGPPSSTAATTNYAALVDATTGLRSLSGVISLGTTPRKSNTNILSVPNIVTTHNKQATIFVGESRPTISSYVNNGNGGSSNVGSGYTSNVTYTKIGIQLTVTPLIGNDGSVQLDIKQQVDDVIDNVTIDGNAQPVIGSRTTESFVTGKSGEILVLGGLQRKSKTYSATRLGSVPIIGALLGSRKSETVRTDLVFFLRPYILTNSEVDNKEAMERLQDSPQRKDVETALSGNLTRKK